MLIRERTEEMEYKFLTLFAAKSREAKRKNNEKYCDIRTEFQRDRDRIIHSKAFRRLKHKTQVYISPGDHYRMRMTHSLEVAQISRTISRSLKLNEDLTEAIALGHDVGHTPFGHVGEYALREILGHFNHNEQSLRVVKILEHNGHGLNLTKEVMDGILNHTGKNIPYTLEGNVVRISDRIAYLCHDYDDGIRAKIIKPINLPEFVIKILGSNSSKMIKVMVYDIIKMSQDKNFIKASSEVQRAIDCFREFMFEKIYNSTLLENDRRKAMYIIHKLFEYYINSPQTMSQNLLYEENKWDIKVIVTDYVSGLSDQFAINLFKELFIPSIWSMNSNLIGPTIKIHSKKSCNKNV